MVKLTLSCAMCFDSEEKEVDVSEPESGITLADAVRLACKSGRKKWILQENDKHLDVYCSRECAK